METHISDQIRQAFGSSSLYEVFNLSENASEQDIKKVNDYKYVRKFLLNS